MQRWFNISLLGVLALAGCASLESKRVAKEPNVVVVRNSTTEEIYDVVLEATKNDPSQITRYAEISPVPQGISQTLVRREDHPPLPRRITVHWTTRGGRKINQKLDVSKLLKRSKGSEDEVLVFEIVSFGRAKAYLEYGTPSYP